MSYQKQNFVNGEVLTASELNHIEQGIVDAESTANETKTVVDKIIDPTLSLSGKAADAAKVGEAINAESERAKGVENQLKEDLDNTSNKLEAAIIMPNLIDKAKYESGKFITNNTVQPSNDYSHIFVKVKPNTDYTYTQDFAGNLEFGFTDKNKKYIVGTWHPDIYGQNTLKQTFVSPADCTFIVINVDNHSIEHSQLETGKDTVGFFPYGTGYTSKKLRLTDAVTYDVIVGKNLLNPVDCVLEAGGFYGYINISIEPNTNYVFSKGEDTSNLYITEKNSAGQTTASKELYGDKSKTYIFTSNENTMLLNIRCAYNALVGAGQLEKGTVKTKYEKYFGTSKMIQNDVFLQMALDNKENIEKINTSVDAINQKLGSNFVTPYTEEENALIYKSEQTMDKSVVRFVLFADVHGSDILNGYEPPESSTKYGNNGYKNYREFARIARKIAEKVGADFVVNLGDTINSTVDEAKNDYNKAECKKRFTEFTRNVQGYIPYIFATAHHEMHPINLSTGEGYADALNHSEVYGIANRYTRNIEIISNSDDTNKNYYYFDMPVQNVRCIVLDSCSNTNFGYSDKEIAWLIDVALNTNHKILVFSHMGTKGNNTGISSPPVNGEQVENALKNKNVLGYFHGHTHWDNIINPSVSGVDFPYISTVNSWCTKSNLPPNVSEILGSPTTYDRKYDSYTEYAFDVVSVNAETGKINMFRFGAGADRVYP